MNKTGIYICVGMSWVETTEAETKTDRSNLMNVFEEQKRCYLVVTAKLLIGVVPR